MTPPHAVACHSSRGGRFEKDVFFIFSRSYSTAGQARPPRTRKTPLLGASSGKKDKFGKSSIVQKRWRTDVNQGLFVPSRSVLVLDEADCLPLAMNAEKRASDGASRFPLPLQFPTSFFISPFPVRGGKEENGGGGGGRALLLPSLSLFFQRPNPQRSHHSVAFRCPAKGRKGKKCGRDLERNWCNGTGPLVRNITRNACGGKSSRHCMGMPQRPRGAFPTSCLANPPILEKKANFPLLLFSSLFRTRKWEIDEGGRKELET